MRKKMDLFGDFPSLLNLDSLVDIVSNNVGILVILAVFMGMFSISEKSEQLPVEEEAQEQVEKVKIPWSHASQKNNLLLLLRDNRVLFLDRALVYQRLKKYLSGKSVEKCSGLPEISRDLRVPGESPWRPDWPPAHTDEVAADPMGVLRRVRALHRG